MALFQQAKNSAKNQNKGSNLRKLQSLKADVATVVSLAIRK